MSSLNAGLTAVLAAVLSVSSCSSQTHDSRPPPTHTDEPVVTGEPAGNNAADVIFADAVIDQDQQGIELAALVPSRSTNSDFVAFAATSASARRSEATILKVLQVQWNSNQDDPVSQPHGTTTTGVVDQATISKLHSLHGGAFETLWLQTMIGLDKASTDMASTEIANGKNVDAVDVAKQIGAARGAEIDQMKKMLGT